MYECNVGCRIEFFNVYVKESNHYRVYEDGEWQLRDMIPGSEELFEIECPECGNIQDTVFSVEETEEYIEALRV